MGEDERYEVFVLEPLRSQATPEVWEGYVRGDFELNWFDKRSFEILDGEELIGFMSEGVWSES